GDLVAVDLDAVVRGEILDVDGAVLLGEFRVLARNVTFGQPDRVAFLPADRDLVPDERDHGRLALVIFYDELVHALRRSGDRADGVKQFISLGLTRQQPIPDGPGQRPAVWVVRSSAGRAAKICQALR